MSVAEIKPVELTDEELQRILTANRPIETDDRRASPRHPFFAAATLRGADRGEWPISGYSRDISAGGLGLLVTAAVYAGEEFEIELQQGDERWVRNATVLWCNPVGDRLYMCGCRFI